MIRKPEPADPPHVENKCDDTDGKAYRRTDAGRCAEQRGQDRKHDIAEQTPERREQNRGAEDPVRGGIVGRRRTIGDTKEATHQRVGRRPSRAGRACAGRDDRLAHRAQVTTSTVASPAGASSAARLTSVAGDDAPAPTSAPGAPESGSVGVTSLARLPGTERTRRFRPQLRWELIGCGLHGHVLVGTDARTVRPEDHLFVRYADGLRWYRCLRCDSWLPLAAPASAPNPYPPARGDIQLPLRGKPLRDRYVLRLIALDRVVHFLVLAALAVAIILFANDQKELRGDYTRFLNVLQAGVGGPFFDANHNGLLRELNHLVSLSSGKLYLYGSAIAAYAAINAFEAVGLWRARRWAEYLTLLEVSVLLPLEIYELTLKISYLKIITLVLNIAVVSYLLLAHRLLGIRGGGHTNQAELDRDTGWGPLERATPVPSQLPVLGFSEE